MESAGRGRVVRRRRGHLPGRGLDLEGEAIDDRRAEIAKHEIAAAGVFPQHLECLAGNDPVPFRDHAFGLFDDDATREGMLQLVTFSPSGVPFGPEAVPLSLNEGQGPAGLQKSR